ncbi:MAG: TetR family transcriptional regulator [Rhodobacteraceae bacterium]|nr:TetR family transcriptional regulator [Paracoccaceae bacterium]
MKNKTLAKPGSDAGIRRILEAACTAFATRGFDGASLRAISREAGVLHTAMLYHFKTKDALWRAVMSELFDDFNGRIDRRTEEMKDATLDALARQLIRVFVHFCAERPELHRIMTIEGLSDTPRLAWLYDNHTKRLFATVDAMKSAADQTVFDDPARLYYVIVGLAASTFTLAPEYKRLSGRDPFSDEEVEATASLVERILFGPPAS